MCHLYDVSRRWFTSRGWARSSVVCVGGGAGSVSTVPSLSLRRDSDNLSDEWFTFNHKYWMEDIKFKDRLYQYAGGHQNFFVEWHESEVFGVPPQCHGKPFREHPTLDGLLWGQSFTYAPFSPVFALLSGIYKAYSGVAGCVAMDTRMENPLMKLAYFFAVFFDGHSSHTFG